jgi:hypothetical protein
MAKPPAVKIPVRLDKGSIEKDARGVRDSLTSSLGGVAVAAAGAVAAYKALSAAFGAAVRIGKEAVKLSTIQIEAERKLIAAARMRGEFTDEQFQALQKLNAETQRATGIGDEQQLKMQAQMAMMGLRNDQLATATKATIGLAEATGQDLNSAMRIVVRTYAGNTSALKRYGIQAKSSADAMRILLQNFEIAKTRTQTLAGQTKVLGAAYGDMLEVFGSSLTKSGAAAGAVETLTNAVTRFTTFIGGDSAQRAINRFFSGLLVKTADAIDALMGLTGAIGEAFGGKSEFQKREENLQALIKGGADPKKARAWVMAEFPENFREITERMADEARQAAKAGITGTAEGVPGFGTLPGKPGKTGKTGAGAAGAGAAGDTQNAHLAAFEHEKQIRADIADLRARELEATAEFNAKQTDLETQRLIAQRENLDAINADRKRFFDQFATISVQGMTQFISGMIVSAAQGRLSFGAAIKGLFATLIDGVGNMMIQLGTAAILLGKAGSVAPWLAAITGGPLGVKAGIGLVIGGAVLKGAAGALRSSGAAATEAAGAAAGNAAARRAPTAAGIDTEPTGFDARRGRPENRTTVINVSFPGTLPGAEERQARAIQRLLGADDEFSLLPAGG